MQASSDSYSKQLRDFGLEELPMANFEAFPQLKEPFNI